MVGFVMEEKGHPARAGGWQAVWLREEKPAASVPT
jgi:hypothetical protein